VYKNFQLDLNTFLTLFNTIIHSSFIIPYNFRFAFETNDSITISWSTKTPYESNSVIFGDYSPDKLDLFSEGN